MSDPGQPPYPQQPYGGGYYQQPPPNHPSAVTSLVLGILSLVMCGFFTGIPAMITGRRVIREVRASPGTYGGEGLGQAGFWTGLVGTVLTCLSGLLVVVVFAFGGVIHSTFQNTCTQVDQRGHQSSC